MTVRRTLPYRRELRTFDFEVDGARYVASARFFETGGAEDVARNKNEPAWDEGALTKIEQNVLGCFLHLRDGWSEALPDLQAFPLIDPLHQRIGRMIVQVADDGEEPSNVTVAMALADDPAGAEMDVGEYLFGLATAAPSIVSATDLKKRLAEWQSRHSDLRGVRRERTVTAANSIFESAGFVSGFTPPDYLLDGVLQRGFIYSLTGATGAGKTAVAMLLMAHAALGRPLGGREVSRTRCLMLVGENADDVRARWIGLAHGMEFDPETIDVAFMPGVFNVAERFDEIHAYAAGTGGFGLVVVDTSAAYFPGFDENNNTEAGDHARVLRSLTTLPGKPCVVVNCHPTKTAKTDNLLPRGGGAFIAEVDGNLTCATKGGGSEVHTEGKFRGPEFEPMMFETVTIKCDRLKDSRGRHVPTVVARALSQVACEALAEIEDRDSRRLLGCMRDHDGASIANLAKAMGWTLSNGGPNKTKVKRNLIKLQKDRLVEQQLNTWVLTDAGRKVAKRAKNDL
jgi:hypothetical protein